MQIIFITPYLVIKKKTLNLFSYFSLAKILDWDYRGCWVWLPAGFSCQGLEEPKSPQNPIIKSISLWTFLAFAAETIIFILEINSIGGFKTVSSLILNKIEGFKLDASFLSFFFI